MLTKPPSCQGCPLAETGLGFSVPDGDGSSGVALVGTTLGKHGAEAGRPLTGRSGHLLNKALELAGVNRGALKVFTLIWCCPPENKLVGMPYRLPATQHCTNHHLIPGLKQMKPKVIVALGSVATEFFTAQTDDMEVIRGYPVWSVTHKAWILPTYDPDFIHKGNYNLEPFLIHDLQRAAEIARDGYKPRWGNYLLDPSVESAWAWARRVAQIPGPLAFDGEWDRHTKRLHRMSFAREEFSGISFSTRTEYYPILRFLLENDWDKCVWNRSADVPVLAGHGVTVGGTVHDSMIAWHVLHTDLPKGLDVVASVLCPEQPRWGHMGGTQPALYSAVDSDILLRIHNKVMRQLIERGRMHVYDRHIVQLDKRLTKMSKRGMPVNKVRQLAAAQAMHDEIQKLTGEIAAAVPVEIRSVSPKQGYKRTPKDTTGMIVRTFETPDGPVERYARLDPLKVSSHLILRYQRYHGHPIVYDREPGQKPKPTTNNAAMLKALFKHPEDPIYTRIQGLRRLGVFRNVVGKVEDGKLVGGIKTGADGRVHTLFNHNPSTLRLASEDPPLQNIPRPQDPWAAMCRGIFEAAPGKLLMERDFGGIEAKITGYCAGSRAMVYLSDIDIHTWNTAHWMQEQKKITYHDLPSIEWSRKDLTEYLKKHKKLWPDERQGIKVQTHAMNYLAKPKEIQEILLNELEWVVDLKDIKAFYQFYRELFPEIPRYHRNLVAAVEGIEEVQIQGLKTGLHWIENPFGYVHHFYHCASWEKIGDKWQWDLGPSATDLAAFPGQSIAAAIGKEALLRFEVEEPELVEDLLLFIHDSLLGEWPEELADRVQLALQRVMEREIEEMPMPGEWGLGRYFTVTSEGKQGKDWGAMGDSRI